MLQNQPILSTDSVVGSFIFLCTGYCIHCCSENSPQPLTIDLMTVEPFPIELVTGHEVTLAAQITLTEELPVGTTVDIKLVKQGIFNIPIPCIDIGGVSVGSW